MSRFLANARSLNSPVKQLTRSLFFLYVLVGNTLVTASEEVGESTDGDLVNATDAESKFEEALAWFNGDGVDQDQKRAALLFREAAEEGYAQAQYHLGIILMVGLGVLP